MGVAGTQMALDPNAKVVPEPVCPHCGADPMALQIAQTVIGGLGIYIYFCGNQTCRRLFNIVSMPPMPKLPGGRVVVPPSMAPRRVI